MARSNDTVITLQVLKQLRSDILELAAEVAELKSLMHSDGDSDWSEYTLESDDDESVASAQSAPF